MFQGIEHVGIASPDPEKLARWYEEHLDFHIHYRPANGKAVFLKALDGPMIEIIAANASSFSQPGMQDRGIRHLAIAVTDFEAAYRRLADKGVRFLNQPTTATGATTVFFTDADGNVLHLLRREQPLR